MGFFDKFKNKKNTSDKNEPLTIYEKWAADVESYKNENYKAKIEEGQCRRCANRINGNTLKCLKFEVIPKEILSGKKKCKDRIERTI